MAKKILIIVALVAIVFYVVLSVVTGGGSKKAKPPDIDGAPYVVQTASRVYYAMEYRDVGGTIVIDDYYELASGSWEFNDRMLVLDSSFGEVTIRRR